MTLTKSKYTAAEKSFIKSKIPDIPFKNISESLCQFWINYKNVIPHEE